MDLTNEDVADVLALLDSLPYDSLDLETSRFRLTLRRAPGGTAGPRSPRSSPSRPSSPHRSSLRSQRTPAPAMRPPRTRDAQPRTGAIRPSPMAWPRSMAPLPGTFYRAPRPGADPFVEVGDAVTPDTVVAIVETMKLMNPVHAGTAGRVARIALENGDFAPLGTTLMLIEPA